MALVLLGALVGGCSAASASPIPRSPTTVTPLRYVVAGDAEFRSEVWAILDAGWTPELVVLAESGPVDFFIWLGDPVETISRCGIPACSGGNAVVIDKDRWFNGRYNKPPDMIPAVWRRFVINHEVGHQLGIPDDVGPCSVMNPEVCTGVWPIMPDDYVRAWARDNLAAPRWPNGNVGNAKA